VPLNLVVVSAIAYVALLFAVAFWAEGAARRGRARWLRGPLIYTLSLSIYCTAWTFYGAVGTAARTGLEFVTIYLGPTLVMVGWWALLRKIVRIGQVQRITSIADMISSRYGKSTALGGLVTAMAVIGTAPYIALQLQSVTLSFAALAGPAQASLNDTALIVAIGLAVFTILFGTRNLDVNERHNGIVTAIALEAVVKLVALMAVGAFVVWGIAGGPSQTFELIEAAPIATWELQPGRWLGLTMLSAAAFLCLPRMFQVMVVENSDERHLATASWAFPSYLFALSLFVVPIAAVGLQVMPAGSNPDLFVLTIPLAQEQDALAMLAFLGGFSSATSMVIVACIALATMMSNHVIVPLWLAMREQGATVSGDVRHVVIGARRASIVGLLALGYVYYRFTGGGAFLASIGLISFCGVAQILPALLGGIFWRGATRAGAGAGLILGFAVWTWTLFLPSFGDGVAVSASTMAEGPMGFGWLRPHALFGISGLDPLLHAFFWSMSLNTLAFIAASLLSKATALERVQGAAMVNVFRFGSGARGWTPATVEAEDLLMMAQRILGGREAQRLFRAEAVAQGKRGFLPDVTPDFLTHLERQLAGSVGAATAHAMVGQITGGLVVSVEELMRVADETAQIMEYSARLEAQSEELSRTAAQLREANEKLTALSIQKDAFLSQISHELRTPMTSIRSFSEILRDGGDMTPEQRSRFSGVIHDEAQRLTRLLDDLLDLGVLENGQVSLRLETVPLSGIIDRSLSASGAVTRMAVARDPAREQVFIETDPDRLSQVFINLIGNAVKYCQAPDPRLDIRVRHAGAGLDIDFVDNGAGIPRESQDVIFEKFARVGDPDAAGGAGLGLAICREIVHRLGGTISYLPGQDGAAFRVHVPLRQNLSAGLAAQ